MTTAAPDRPAFRDHFSTLAAARPGSVLVAHEIVELDATAPPWVGSGLTVLAGDRVTVLVCGRVYLDEASDLWLDPALQVWTRVGDRGPIRRGSRCSDTFTSPHDGEVQLGNANPGEWGDDDGAIGPNTDLYAFMTGGTTVVLLRWAAAVDPAAELRALAAAADFDGLLAGEAERLEQGTGTPPNGWAHHWRIGPSEVFVQADARTIDCSTRNSFSIIRRDADVAFTPDTTLTWRWKVDRLPSPVAEDTLATHDYLSIAVEFDDGRDLTYQWSAGLPAETSYHCPLPHWSERETHLVVRSGPDQLGRWLPETRHVFADRAAAIGGPDPARVTGVWLIAVSFLQHGEGRCAYADISVGDAVDRCVVL